MLGKKNTSYNQVLCSNHNHDDKSSVAINFSSHDHSVGELHYMAVEEVKMQRRGGNVTECFFCLDTIIHNFLGSDDTRS